MRLVVIFVSVFIFSGCASLACREDPQDYCTTVYPGVAYDLGHIVGINSDDGSGGALGRFPRSFLTTISVVDLPFSLLLDTASLPIDLLSLASENQDTEEAKTEN